MLLQLQLVDDQMGLVRLDVKRLESSASGLLFVHVVQRLPCDFRQGGSQGKCTRWNSLIVIKCEVSRTKCDHTIELQNIAYVVVFDFIRQNKFVAFCNQIWHVVDFANGV